MPEIRIPTQKRSIEKRNKIIKKGFELMCEKGYYNVSTIDIANYANVSTGIIYQYFNDKRDIFLEGIKNYSNNIMYPMLNVLEKEEIKIDILQNIFSTMIENCIKTHTISKKAHEELMAMSHLDKDIGEIFTNAELEMTEKMVKLLEINNFHINNCIEKVHIIIGLIDNLCHEVVYHKHLRFDYKTMKNEVVNIILYILK